MRARTPVLLLAIAAALAAAPSEAHRRAPRWYWGATWAWSPWVSHPWYAMPAGAVLGDLAAVDTDVSPEHARVYLDGELIGTADDFDGYPSLLYLEPGRYVLEFKLPGYRDERVEVEAEAGRFFPMDTEMAREPGQAAAPWYDRPEGLPRSYVFGKPGRSGADERLRPDLRRRERDEAAERRREAEEQRREAREEARERAEEEREEARQRAEEAREEARERAEEEREEARERETESDDVAADERGDVVDDERGDARPVPHRPARERAALRLEVTPAGASVYLDGEFLGTGEELSRLERGVGVQPGRHRIDVLAPGREPRTVEVDVEAGSPKQVVIELDEKRE